MPATLKIKSDDLVVRSQRETTATRVIAHFGNQLPELRLLCFFDDIDWQPLKDYFGEANRGFYGPIKENPLTWPPWPDYVANYIFVDFPAWLLKRAFDHIIYLHGSTCDNEIGLTMTFAHELQHFVQHSSVLNLWAQNSLIQHLPKSVIKTLGLKWSDIPIEREARIVSKRIAENLFGFEPVRQHIDTKISRAVNADDAADWRFVQGLVASNPPQHLTYETRLIFKRLKDHRLDLEKLLHELKDDSDFKDVDLDALFDEPSS
jgi:hypothetical protein